MKSRKTISSPGSQGGEVRQGLFLHNSTEGGRRDILKKGTRMETKTTIP